MISQVLKEDKINPNIYERKKPLQNNTAKFLAIEPNKRIQTNCIYF